MSDSGSTVGTPIVPSPGGPSGSAQQTLTLNTVPASSTLIPEQSVITLALYAHIINYHERPFFGVSAAGLDEDQCRNIWTKHQRDEIAYYLAEAQVEIENLAGMFLQPTYVYLSFFYHL